MPSLHHKSACTRRAFHCHHLMDYTDRPGHYNELMDPRAYEAAKPWGGVNSTITKPTESSCRCTDFFSSVSLINNIYIYKHTPFPPVSLELIVVVGMIKNCMYIFFLHLPTKRMRRIICMPH